MLVDIDTDDGLEQAVLIVGPADSGEADSLKVRFLDRTEDDWEVADFTEPKWQTGMLVDIDTDDGIEKGAKILGPPESSEKGELRVEFADGTLDDWETSSFSVAGADQAASEPARQSFKAPNFDSGSSEEEDDAPEAQPDTPKPQEAAAEPEPASPVMDDDPFGDLDAIMAGMSLDDNASEESEVAAEDSNDVDEDPFAMLESMLGDSD